MFIIRNVQKSDLSSLLELSSLMVFLNLPHDEKKLQQIISDSQRSFSSPSPDLSQNTYVFVIEDLETQKVVGVSMIHAQHGTLEEPHYALKVGTEHKFCKSLNTGFIHGTLRLNIDTNGPTEIGGLVVHPDYRRHQEKIGKQVSFARFLYIAQNRKQFRDILHCELMPPFDQNGKSPLWEAIGRRFMNMDYLEADLMSRENKDFILSLFPSDNIYQTLLPVSARKAIGEVNAKTIPVKKMLEKIGFQYINEVDPFDGGPHYQCATDKVLPIKNKLQGKVQFNSHFDQEKENERYLISVDHPNFDFYAFLSPAMTQGNNLILPKFMEKHFQDSKNLETIAIKI